MGTAAPGWLAGWVGGCRETGADGVLGFGDVWTATVELVIEGWTSAQEGVAGRQAGSTVLVCFFLVLSLYCAVQHRRTVGAVGQVCRLLMVDPLHVCRVTKS